MKKFIFKIFVFSCLLILVFMGLNKIFTPFKFFEKTMDEYKKDKGNLDVAIFGSSHAYRSFDVRLIEDKLGLNAFNFGGTAQRLETTNAVMSKVVEENNLKLIIVDIFSMSIDGMKNERSKHLQLRTLDYLPLSLNKTKQSSVIFDNSYLPFALFPFLRRHSQWGKVHFLSFSRDYKLSHDSDFYNGFYAANKTFTNKTWEKFKNKHQNTTEDKNFKNLSNSQQKEINGIIKIARSHDIPILFANSPSYVSSYNINYRKTTKYIKKLLNEKRVPFIDFDKLRTAERMQKTDFQDPNHLNTKGAMLVTDSLVHYIKKNYHFQNDRKKAYSFWKNKFYQIKHHFKKAPIHEILNSRTVKKVGIHQVAIIRSSEGRIELILQTNSKKTIPVKFEFALSDVQYKELFLKDEMYIKDKMYLKWGKLNRSTSFKYDGKNYRSFQVYFPFDKITQIKIYAGKGNKVKILDEKNIDL